MPRPRQHTTTITTTNNSIKVSTTTSEAPKAKNAANQDGLDRLHQLAQNSATPYYVLTLQRAIKAVRFCPHALTTIDQAVQLKYVGARLARIIVPASTSSSSSLTAAAAMTTSHHPQQQQQQQPGPPPQQPRASNTSLTEKRTTATTNNADTTSTTAAYSNSTKQQAYFSAKHNAETLHLPSGPWKVWLLVDTREHRSQTVVSRCQQAGIPCQERVLPIGDMTWIAQCNDIEIILGTILERKQVADLVGSIFGTRFLEQRLRLKHCGVPQILYLVEGDLNSTPNCPADTLRMAMMETRMQSGFQILQTKHLDDTVRLLKGLHRRIIQRTFPTSLEELPTFVGRNSSGRGKTGGNGRRQRRPVSLLELVFETPPRPALGQTRFTTFGELKAKIEFDREVGTQTVGAIYQAMLKQVPTFSQKKCQAIAAVYPTWSHLLADPNRNVAAISCGRQAVGPKSAAELELVCRLLQDGTMIQQQPLEASTKPWAPTTATATTSTLPMADVGVSTATTSSMANTTTATTHECLDLTQDSPAPARADDHRASWNQDQIGRALEFPCSKEQDEQNCERRQPLRELQNLREQQDLESSTKRPAIDPVEPSSYAQHEVGHSKRKHTHDTISVGSLSPSSNEPVWMKCSTTNNNNNNNRKQSIDTSIDLSLSSDDETSPLKKHRVSFQSQESHGNDIANPTNAASKPLPLSFLSDSDDDDDESTLPVPTTHAVDQYHDDLERKPSSNDKGTSTPEESSNLLQSPDIGGGKQHGRESFGGDSSVWFTSPSTTCSTPSNAKKSTVNRRHGSNHDVSIVVIDSSDDDDDDDLVCSHSNKRTEPETIVID